MEYELKVVNKPLYYIELVALLNRLVLERTYKNIALNQSQNAFLDILKGFRIKGLELFELYLMNEKLDCISTLEMELMKLEETDFLYLVFGEVLSKEEIKKLKQDLEEKDRLYTDNMFLSSYSWESLEYVLFHTKDFIEKLIDLFKAISKSAEMQIGQPETYQESIAKISMELKAKIPLEVAQGIMGKRFKRVDDYSTYYFVPSYFYMHKPMRTFNRRTQIVIYPAQELNRYDKASLANALRVIGDDTRLEIIEKLSQRPMFGKELAKELGLGTSTVSHHLEQLRSIGLIHEERDKSVKYFSINFNEYTRLCEDMRSFVKNK